MLDNINLETILFIDIETVPMTPVYEDLPASFRKLWDKKSETLSKFDRNGTEVSKTPAEWYERAGIYAEFGKIICISTGAHRSGALWIRSYYGDDEKAILKEFASMLEKSADKKFLYLCAHNGKEFDYPYLIRRMLINGIQVPALLDLSGKKPWEVNHLDTMELWKFGDYKSYTSLELLAALFNIPTPKDDIEGKDVARVYYAEKDLPRIVTYCQKDVITIVNLLLKLKGKELVPEERITYV
jgi:DNA polymerase elongation subunit (family B)